MAVRLNKYIAMHTSFSRRAADELIQRNRVLINDQPATPGVGVEEGDVVKVDDEIIGDSGDIAIKTIILNKPVGFVCSRDGQGNRTIYELLPYELQHLNSVGRLDKNSSGLLLLTNDGQLANQLTHPRYKKTKVYEVSLDKPLTPLHQQMISDFGIQLEDGPSKLLIEKQDSSALHLSVTMHEGRNRQIRRTFEALGYSVAKLHRITFGTYQLGDLPPGQTTIVQG